MVPSAPTHRHTCRVTAQCSPGYLESPKGPEADWMTQVRNPWRMSPAGPTEQQESMRPRGRWGGGGESGGCCASHPIIKGRCLKDCVSLPESWPEGFRPSPKANRMSSEAALSLTRPKSTAVLVAVTLILEENERLGHC